MDAAILYCVSIQIILHMNSIEETDQPVNNFKYRPHQQRKARKTLVNSDPLHCHSSDRVMFQSVF